MPISFKLVVLGLFVAFIGLFMVQRDVRLKLFGRTVEAEVMHDYESSTPSFSKAGVARDALIGPRDSSLGITYRFKDIKGESVLGGGKLPMDYTGSNPSNGTLQGAPKFLTVKVIYLPGHSEINQMVDDPSNPYYTLYIGLGLVALGVVLGKFESRAAIAHRIKKPISPPPGLPPEPTVQLKEEPKVMDFD